MKKKLLFIGLDVHAKNITVAIRAIGSAEERIGRLEEQMAALLESWHMKPVVAAMMAMRGFALVGAMVLVSELGGAWRFDHPRRGHGHAWPPSRARAQITRSITTSRHRHFQAVTMIALR